jgi:hypothetical protein
MPESLKKYESMTASTKQLMTDPDATFMRMEDHMLNGQLKPGYNSKQNQYILEYTLHQNPTDVLPLTWNP